MTLTGYVDWVPSQHIFANNNALLSTLYALLTVPELNLAAIEVLQLIVNRKASEETNLLLSIFQHIQYVMLHFDLGILWPISSGCVMTPNIGFHFHNFYAYNSVGITAVCVGQMLSNVFF